MRTAGHLIAWLLVGVLAVASAGCADSDGNRRPVADAGPDQTINVLAGDVVILDGSASHDPEGHPLTYSWSLEVMPSGSAAELSDPTVPNPNFVADKPGTYEASLTVNDGFIDSTPDDVSISVAVPPPVVSIISPENLTVVMESTVTVTGTVDDPDAAITVNGDAVANASGNFTADIALEEGSNTVTVVGRNNTGEGSDSVEVIFNTGLGPALRITSHTNPFIAGEEFDIGEPFQAAQVDVAGVIKVNTTSSFPDPFPDPDLNKPTVTVNGVSADVELNPFFTECSILNPFQCWRFTATIALERGNRIITAVGTDVDGLSTTVSIGGIVDYCRIGEFNPDGASPGKDTGVVALAGPNNDIQSNRCHEIDGCSGPLGPFANNPMEAPTPFPLPADFNMASTAFGEGTRPPEEYFVHGLKSAFDLPCNNHDVCYQTCVRVTGLSVSEREEAWEAVWHVCNRQMYSETVAVCRRAYPERCPFTIPGTSVPDPVICPEWQLEKAFCYDTALAYLKGIESPGGLERFEDRQIDYCADN